MLLGIPCCFSMGLTCWFKHGSFSLATSWFHPGSNCMFAATQTNTLKLHSIGNVCCHIMADLVLVSAGCLEGEALKSVGLLLSLTVFSTQELCFCFCIFCWQMGYVMQSLFLWDHYINIYLTIHTWLVPMLSWDRYVLVFLHSWHFSESQYPWLREYLCSDIRWVLLLFRTKVPVVMPMISKVLCTFPSSLWNIGIFQETSDREGVIPCCWSSLLPVNSMTHRSAMLSISFT